MFNNINEVLLLDAGSGGLASQRLINSLFIKYFNNPILAQLDDAASLQLTGPLAMSTDAYTVTPLFFPGGDIGKLAIHGTVNDVAMLGARPRYLTCSFILEAGLSLAVLEKIVISMAEAALEAEVQIVSGDTKVVPAGACDQIFITTTGIGEILVNPHPKGSRAAAGDVILVSGNLGDHGLAVLGQRDNLDFLGQVRSDTAALNQVTMALVQNLNSVHVLRDPTRGGLATTLNEIAQQSQVNFLLDEKLMPVQAEVQAGCDILGLDPLYLANEGKFICILPEADAPEALEIMRSFKVSQGARQIGQVLGESYTDAFKGALPKGALAKPLIQGVGKVILQTHMGGHRLLSMLEGDQLPRIC